MKKKLLILAVAGLALASCSSDETTASLATSEANEISFRALNSGVTRAAETTLESFTTTQGFYVGAWKNSDHSSYFPDTEFKKDGSTTNYRSDTKYYWPASGNLDFVGFYPNKDNTNGPLKHLAWNTFTFEPAATVASHVDYVIAATLNQSKASSTNGVPLAFKHLGSWIELKAYNSKGNANGNMKTSVQGWKIGYLHNGGVYTISSSTANGTALSSTGSWNYDSYPVHSSNVPTEYKETLASAVTTATDGACDESGEAATIGNAMIIVPQPTTKMTGASTYATGGYLTGAFIAVKLQITDGSDHVIVDATGTTQVSEATRDLWAIWPINNDWADGMKYTYVIDLSQGGYKEIGTAGGVLEKWLDGAEIFFNTVTVTGWATGSPAVVNPS